MEVDSLLSSWQNVMDLLHLCLRGMCHDVGTSAISVVRATISIDLRIWRVRYAKRIRVLRVAWWTVETRSVGKDAISVSIADREVVEPHFWWVHFRSSSYARSYWSARSTYGVG